MTEAEKQTLANHVAATVKRLLACKGVDGSFAQAQKVLEVGQWLEKVEATPDAS